MVGTQPLSPFFLSEQCSKGPPFSSPSWGRLTAKASLVMTEEGMMWEEAIFNISLFTLSGLKCVNLYSIVWFLTLPSLSLQGSYFKVLNTCPVINWSLSHCSTFPEDSFAVIFDGMLESGLYLGEEVYPSMSYIHRIHFKRVYYWTHPGWQSLCTLLCRCVCNIIPWNSL